MTNGPLSFHLTSTPEPPALRTVGAPGFAPGGTWRFQIATVDSCAVEIVFERAPSTWSANAKACSSGVAAGGFCAEVDSVPARTERTPANPPNPSIEPRTIEANRRADM